MTDTNYARMPVADVARAIAKLFPDCWDTTRQLTDYANRIFVEVPGFRRQDLLYIARIINSAADGNDTTKDWWPEVKRIFDAACGRIPAQ